eukprot:7269263-Heterocapsa_arctica.AAC.1
MPSCQQSPGRAPLDTTKATSSASTSRWTTTTTVTGGARGAAGRPPSSTRTSYGATGIALRRNIGSPMLFFDIGSPICTASDRCMASAQNAAQK